MEGRKTEWKDGRIEGRKKTPHTSQSPPRAVGRTKQIGVAVFKPCPELQATHNATGTAVGLWDEANSRVSSYFGHLSFFSF